jgi:16S rRNA (adenine1518-N6/adenine1519-N6)-dimethyltransferase
MLRIRSKKSLGQNFLTDKNITQKIIQACELSQEDFILEIGPGQGILTKELVKVAKNVFAVEKDEKLAQALAFNLKDYKNLKVIRGDILKYKIETKATKVIGNIPYYITTPIIEHLLNQKGKIDTIFVTIQKEVAQRLTAKPGSKIYGSLSIFVQYHTIPEIKFFISRGCFKPQPKVDSAFVGLKMRQAPAVRVEDEELFFKIVRTSFSQRRKMISNTLKNFVSAEEILQLGIASSKRPEELSLEDFAKLTGKAGGFQ